MPADTATANATKAYPRSPRMSTTTVATAQTSVVIIQAMRPNCTPPEWHVGRSAELLGAAKRGKLWAFKDVKTPDCPQTVLASALPTTSKEE
jgi:hypothetical protein